MQILMVVMALIAPIFAVVIVSIAFGLCNQ